MKRSSVVTLVVLAVLIIAYLLMHESEKRSLSPKETANFLAIDSGAVNKISIHRLGAAVDFEKHGDAWDVNDGGKAYPTEKGTVEQLAELAHTMKVGEVISSNPEKQMLFQVDTLTGNNITFYRDATPLGSVIIGKIGPDFQSTYVRKPESPDVYMAIGNFARVLNRPASGYRDKTVLTLDTMQITSIAFRSKDFDYKIVHQDSLWRVEASKGEPFVPDPMKISQLLRQLAIVRCNNFITEQDTAKPNFAQPSSQVDIALSDGTERSLQFVAQGGESKNYYARSSAFDETFIVYDYVVNNLVKKPDDLKRSTS